jgi:DNA-binding FadR family transcriptional regulator
VAKQTAANGTAAELVRQDGNESLRRLTLAIAPAGGIRRRAKRSELVARQLAAYIIDADLASGTSLPSEKELIEIFGVARTTIREALRLLETRGVIRIRTGPSGGPVVRRPKLSDLGESLSLMMQFSRASLEEIMHARTLLEATTARLAASIIDDGQISRLRDVSENLAGAINDDARFGLENIEFHDIIARASGSTVLRIFLASINNISDARNSGVTYTPKFRREIVQDHNEIVEALAAHDANAAEQAMIRHLHNGLTFWKREYRDLVARPISWDF